MEVRRVLLGLAVALGLVVLHPSPATFAVEEVWSGDIDGRREFTSVGESQTIERDEPIQPRTIEDGPPPYVMIALTTVLVACGCLYLLFRRGSIAYRARQDEDRSSQA